LHRSASTTRAKDTVLADGWRMLSVHVAGEDQAGFPAASSAVFALEHVS
jgi:hypothetical protein